MSEVKCGYEVRLHLEPYDRSKGKYAVSVWFPNDDGVMVCVGGKAGDNKTALVSWSESNSHRLFHEWRQKQAKRNLQLLNKVSALAVLVEEEETQPQPDKVGEWGVTRKPRYWNHDTWTVRVGHSEMMMEKHDREGPFRLVFRENDDDSTIRYVTMFYPSLIRDWEGPLKGNPGQDDYYKVNARKLYADGLVPGVHGSIGKQA